MTIDNPINIRREIVKEMGVVARKTIELGYAKTIYDINNGECENFACEVLDNLTTKFGKDFIAQNTLEAVTYGDHFFLWAVIKGENWFFDSLTPQGVKSFFELPITKYWVFVHNNRHKEAEKLMAEMEAFTLEQLLGYEPVNEQLVIKSKHDDGWEFVFRKEAQRPIEMLRRHETLGQLCGWQVAKNLCLKALVSRETLAEYFGITEREFNYSHLEKGVSEEP